MNGTRRASVSPFPSVSKASGRPVADRLKSLARQRGAIGIFGVVTLLLALLVTALSIDSGRLWLERRHLQSVADIAAIEAVRNVGYCGATGTDEQVLLAAKAAAEANHFAGNLALAPNKVEVGSITIDGNRRQFNTGGARQAVRVEASNTVPASLILGGLWGNTTTITAEATAVPNPDTADYSLGSFLLRVAPPTGQETNLLNSLLDSLLGPGSSLSLDALSYQGLAKTNIKLGELAAANATVGSVDELLQADLTVSDVLTASARAISRQGSSEVEVQAANGMAVLAAAVTNNVAIQLGDIIDVAAPAANGDAAAAASVNALDLVMATLMLANRNSAVALNLGIPNVLGISLNVIQPPQLVAGGLPGTQGGQWCSEAKTAQLTLRVTLNPLGIGLVDMALNLDLAQARANLAALAIGNPSTVTIDVSPGIANVSVTNGARTGPASVLLGVGRVGLQLPVSASAPTHVDYSVSLPIQAHLPDSRPVAGVLSGDLATALSDPNLLTVQILGFDVTGSTQRNVRAVVASLLSDVAAALLDPLLRILGIQLGGADVTLLNLNSGRRGVLVI